MDIVRNLLLYDDDNAGCNLWLRGCVRCNPFRGCAILAVSVRDMDDPISPVYKSGQDMSRSGLECFPLDGLKSSVPTYLTYCLDPTFGSSLDISLNDRSPEDQQACDREN